MSNNFSNIFETNTMQLGFLNKELDLTNNIDPVNCQTAPTYEMLAEFLKAYPQDEKMRLIEAMWEIMDKNQKKTIISRYNKHKSSDNTYKIFISFNGELDIELAAGSVRRKFELTDSKYYTVVYVMYILDRWSDRFTPHHSNKILRIGSRNINNNGNLKYNYKQVFDDVWDFLYGYSGNLENFFGFLGKEILRSTGAVTKDNFYSKSYSRINKHLYSLFANNDAAPFIIGKDTHLGIHSSAIHTDATVDKFFKAIFLRNKYECFGKARIFEIVNKKSCNDLSRDLELNGIQPPAGKTWQTVIQENFGERGKRPNWNDLAAANIL